MFKCVVQIFGILLCFTCDTYQGTWRLSNSCWELVQELMPRWVYLQPTHRSVLSPTAVLRMMKKLAATKSIKFYFNMELSYDCTDISSPRVKTHLYGQESSRCYSQSYISSAWQALHSDVQPPRPVESTVWNINFV